MQKFTVIATDESTGKTAAFHVLGESGLNAFAAAAAISDSLEMVVALPGWLQDGVQLHFPGEGTVDSGSVTDQSETYGAAPCSLDANLVVEVLRAYSLRVSDTNGESFESMAAELVGELDKALLIEKAYEMAPEDADSDACEQALFDLVHQALVDKGVIEF
ncbi:hypothetical protein ACRCPS_17560 [Pseudomonas aeruginosa]